ncbi:MAG: hypothetical protein HOP36_12340 [Methyloglobulus sp.]|nr:hypothetical protein [Methyloglobulus sp.]
MLNADRQTTYKTHKKSGFLKTLVVLGSMLIGASAAVAAVPALFLEQSSITGVSDTLKASRVPVRNAAGAIKYYDIEIKLQLDALGVPVLAPLYPVVGLSPALTVGQFKAGKYKDAYGNVYTVSGPGAASGGRTTWAILLTKTGTSCPSCSLNSGSWTTGAIAGHPIQPVLTAQGITSTAYSWGIIDAANGTSLPPLYLCSAASRAVGASQSGNLLALNGFCGGNNLQTDVMTLNLCTTPNPCP